MTVGWLGPLRNSHGSSRARPWLRTGSGNAQAYVPLLLVVLLRLRLPGSLAGSIGLLGPALGQDRGHFGLKAERWARHTVEAELAERARKPVGECLPFLHRKIEAIRPRIIVALGKPAAQALLSSTAPISALRGRFHEFRGVRVMPTFHPAFLLRQPDRKRDAWSDLKKVMEELERLGVRAPNPPKP